MFANAATPVLGEEGSTEEPALESMYGSRMRSHVLSGERNTVHFDTGCFRFVKEVVLGVVGGNIAPTDHFQYLDYIHRMIVAGAGIAAGLAAELVAGPAADPAIELAVVHNLQEVVYDIVEQGAAGIVRRFLGEEDNMIEFEY